MFTTAGAARATASAKLCTARRAWRFAGGSVGGRPAVPLRRRLAGAARARPGARGADAEQQRGLPPDDQKGGREADNHRSQQETRQVARVLQCDSPHTMTEGHALTVYNAPRNIRLGNTAATGV